MQINKNSSVIDRPGLEARALVIKAMAHPTRLFIIEELSRGKKCVCELTEMLGVDVSTVSKHLSVLKSVGIVKDEKKGLMVFYTLIMPCLLPFMNCIARVLNQDETTSVNPCSCNNCK
ncbi:MAG: winged helix-turn-helix transcriptional regulator [Fibrobacteria bacterium]|nr:winged helix-turn-helix transcriptional regulator [Fibrobacteria bacterium]